MIGKVFVAAFALASVPVAAESTVSFNFGGTAGNASSFVYNETGVQGDLTLTVSSRKFTLAPGALTALSDTTAVGTVVRSSFGLGIVGGGSNSQVDTNLPGTPQSPLREALLLSGTNPTANTNQRFSIHSFVLSLVDANDTLLVYGVKKDGSLTSVGYGIGAVDTGTPGGPGSIIGGLNGEAIGLTYNAALNGGTAAFSVAPTSLFDRYLITTRVGGDTEFGGDLGQGFVLSGITAALPEPGTWAMMIGGFGLAGASMRRRRAAVAA
jgi:hypothetical protein